MKSKIQLLSELISDGGLDLKVTPENNSVSILDDLDYRYAVIALTIDYLGTHNKKSIIIDLSILSFGQFIATRPSLILKVQNYIEGRVKKQICFEEFLGFPRGYIKDYVFKDSLYIIISAGLMNFAKENLQTIEVPIKSQMVELAKSLVESSLLVDEQNALEKLKQLKIPKRVIEWQ